MLDAGLAVLGMIAKLHYVIETGNPDLRSKESVWPELCLMLLDLVKIESGQ